MFQFAILEQSELVLLLQVVTINMAEVHLRA